MEVFQVGGSVVGLTFLGGGGRLLVRSYAEGTPTFQILDIPSGTLVRLQTPPAASPITAFMAEYGHSIAAGDPDGRVVHLAWNEGLLTFDAVDGHLVADRSDVAAQSLILDPTGRHLIAGRGGGLQSPTSLLTAVEFEADGSHRVRWRTNPPGNWDNFLLGFQPGEERFITIVLRFVAVWSYAEGKRMHHTPIAHRPDRWPVLSPDGRTLAATTWSVLYLYELATLGEASPRAIEGTRKHEGTFTVAFHPTNGTLAAINGGPTRIKHYDLATLELIRIDEWRIGPLRSLAFSPDGMLGAAGSRYGRVVVWDVEP